jgi:uncharacterized damage-inducible protein DinB
VSDGSPAWTAPTPPEADGPTTGPERPMLDAYLGFQRRTLLNICAGLDAEQLARRALPPSRLSLLGIVRHLGKVERIWFRIRAAGEDVPPMFDPALGVDPEFELIDASAAADEIEKLQEEWRRCDAALADLPLEATLLDRDGREMSLRMTYLHVLNEYARHNGHADLLREQIDGVTGR